MKLAFWTSCLTKPFDMRVWDEHLGTAFPNLDLPATTSGLSIVRDDVHRSLDDIRRFRNRAYHHEPLLRVNLTARLDAMLDLIGLRCQVTADWVRERESVTAVCNERPG